MTFAGDIVLWEVTCRSLSKLVIFGRERASFEGLTLNERGSLLSSLISSIWAQGSFLYELWLYLLGDLEGCSFCGHRYLWSKDLCLNDGAIWSLTDLLWVGLVWRFLLAISGGTIKVLGLLLREEGGRVITFHSSSCLVEESLYFSELRLNDFLLLSLKLFYPSSVLWCLKVFLELE